MSDPKPFPGVPLARCRFNLVENVSLSRFAGGRAVSRVEYADPYIAAEFETVALHAAERAGMESWRASLRGGLLSFLSFDHSRKELIAYPSGIPEILAATWNGQGTVSAIAGRLITAAGAPTGFIMSAGDVIGLVENGHRYFGFVTETVTRGASTIAVPVEPLVPLSMFTTAATVVFYRPQAEFIILPSTWQQSNEAGPTPISFQAVQKI